MHHAKNKIFVGLSGGVDSAVSAALLQKAGYDVVGVFIKVWQADFLPCTWREERRDAMRVAAHLDIPFRTLDLEKEYKKEVVDYMISEYSAGRVPNPDVMCNKHVKFGAFLDYAIKSGAGGIATGHYARIQRAKRGATSDASYRLYSGADKDKDQSYFLWTLSQPELARTLFPIGHMKKSEVRRIAKRFRLPNSEKKDSQGLCFMGKVNMEDFLRHYLRLSTGDVLDTKGKVIGTHDGALLYAIGQRHGFSIKKSTADQPPYFVIAKDIVRNTVTVAPRTPEESSRFSTIEVRAVNVISPKLREEATECTIRTRYREPLLPATWRMLPQGHASIALATPERYISVGQSLVCYRKDECLGGGIIAKTG